MPTLFGLRLASKPAELTGRRRARARAARGRIEIEVVEAGVRGRRLVVRARRDRARVSLEQRDVAERAPPGGDRIDALVARRAVGIRAVDVSIVVVVDAVEALRLGDRPGAASAAAALRAAGGFRLSRSSSMWSSSTSTSWAPRLPRPSAPARRTSTTDRGTRWARRTPRSTPPTRARLRGPSGSPSHPHARAKARAAPACQAPARRERRSKRALRVVAPRTLPRVTRSKVHLILLMLTRRREGLLLPGATRAGALAECGGAPLACSFSRYTTRAHRVSLWVVEETSTRGPHDDDLPERDLPERCTRSRMR